MNQGLQRAFDSNLGSMQGFLVSGGERASALVVSSSLSERDALRGWAQAQGLVLRTESSWVSATHEWQDETVALRVVDWADLACRSDSMRAVARASSPVLMIVADIDDLDLRNIPPDGRMDILRRPYQAEELIWRVSRAIGRAAPWTDAPSVKDPRRLERGPIVFDEERDSVLVFGKPLSLRRAERAVLVYLMEHADRFVSTRELQGGVLGSHGSGSAARNQVYEVRSKLRSLGLPNAILHEPNRGYRLNWDG